MRIFPISHLIPSRSAIALMIALVAAPPAAVADDLQDASKLFKAGQYQPALERVNKALAVKPKDAEARFLKGLILTEQGNSDEAIDVFLKLTQDYPALPEPYNNLAVIYASQGQYEKARAALEKSIHTHPSYATAYENLGDVYARLASQAYDKALQLDSENTGAQNKLALARELVGAAPQSAPQEVVASAPQPAVAAGQGATLSPASATKEAAPNAKPAATASKAAAAPASRAVAEPTASIEDEIKKTLSGWAQAWSRKDAGAYLAYYAKDFATPRGVSRTKWETVRRDRITAPKSISVSLTAIQVQSSSATRAVATFRQQYRSDLFTGSSRKTLEFVKSDGRWLIQRESIK
jgi:tetratricopeptide (TPR) repeat protein